MDYKSRIGKAQDAALKLRLDALIVMHLANVRYLCGFTGSSAALVVTDKGALLFTDGRYTQQARDEVRGAKIRIVKGKSALAAATEWLRGLRGLKRIGIEPSHMTVADKSTLARSLRSGAKLVDAPAVIEQMRMVKEAEEIAHIRQACHLGAKLFDRLVKNIRAGVPESEVAGDLEFTARKRGAEQMAFPTIIAGGTRSALPHGRASSAKLPRRGFVVCDFGVILAGYCSDMTRTVHLGRASSAESRGVYEAVKGAQQAALEAVKPGSTVGEVDKAARNFLYNRRLGKYLTHSTGHGLGLEIHEVPRVAAGQNDVLKPGMVITVEPGVYLPGKFGVRIEDTVVVNENGYEILTPCSKDLISV
jgi:Xaa-Pro aminopeptidase